LADSDQERAAVQATLDFFDRTTASAPAPSASSAAGQNPTPSQSASNPPGVFLPGPGVTSPRVLREVKPQYTREALDNKVEGTVWVQAVVLPDGNVGNVQVTKSLDRIHGLDEQAIKAARQWRFQPGTRDGSPVPVLVTIELTFTLRGPPSQP
jgi:periplasmic protein TonB